VALGLVGAGPGTAGWDPGAGTGRAGDAAGAG